MKAKHSVKNLFIFLSLLTVPIYTRVLGLKQNPAIFTLSKIGNYFGHRAGFIAWGAITGLLLVTCIFHLFQRTRYKGRFGEKLLTLSYVFLIITVLVPNFRETMTFLFYIHVTSAALFAFCLFMALVFFMAHLHANRKKVFDKCSVLLFVCVGLPLLLLAIFGELTGIAEIAFFFGICTFLAVVNAALLSEERGQRAGAVA
jgi:hypothetical protein